jgi:hypothetical protein
MTLSKMVKLLALVAQQMADAALDMPVVENTYDPNDYVRFRYVKLDFGTHTHTEDAVKAVKLWEGMETCTVGFLTRYVVQTRGSEFVNKVAIVLELYEYSHNSTMRPKSHCQVFALARLCVFLLLAH